MLDELRIQLWMFRILQGKLDASRKVGSIKLKGTSNYLAEYLKKH